MSNKLTSNNLDNQKTCNMNDKTPKEIFLNNPSNPNFKGGDFKYISEEHFNSLIEEKDKEIKALKHKLQLYNNKHRPLK